MMENNPGSSSTSDPFGSVFIDNDPLLLSLSPALKQPHHYHYSEKKSQSQKTDDDVTKEQQQQQQLLHFVNHSLTSMGLATVADSTAIPTLNIIYSLLNQRKTDSQLLEDSRMETTKIQADKQRLAADKIRLRNQANSLEQDVSSAQHSCKRLEADAKKLKKQFNEVRNDLEIKIRKLKAKDTGYVAQQRKNLTVIDQLKERITKLMKSKSASPKNSPRNSPRNSLSSASSSPRLSISIRQNQNWATAAAAAAPTAAISTISTTTTTATTSTSKDTTILFGKTIVQQLEETVVRVNIENKELRLEMEELNSTLIELCDRTNRVERLLSVQQPQNNVSTTHIGSTATTTTTDLPHTWVQADIHTIKIQFQAVRKQLTQLEEDIMRPIPQQEMDSIEAIEVLLSHARNIIYKQDELIQSTLYQRRRARKIMHDRRRSSDDHSTIVSSCFGTLTPLDVESLKLEEEDLATEKQWLQEERAVLKVERLRNRSN